MALATPVPAEGAATDVEEYVAGSSLPAAEAALLVPVLQSFLRRHPGDDTSLMVRAAETATVAHSGQLRRSGEPYITHPIAVAGIVADLGLDAQTVAAALLHDAVEDTGVTNEIIDRDFGPVGRAHRGRGDQARSPPVRLQGGPAGGHRAQDVGGHGQRLAGPDHQAGRPAAQHADPVGDAGVEAAPDRTGDPGHLRATGPPARHPRGQMATRGPGLRHPPPQAVRGDRTDGGQPGPAPGRVLGPRPGVGPGADGGFGGDRRGHRPPEAPVEHLREDGRAGQGVRRPLRPGGDPGHRRVGEGLLGRPRIHPRHLAPGAGPVQGLHQFPQVQPLPVAAHHGDRPRRQADRGAGADPRDAPSGRVRHRRPLGVQGEPGSARSQHAPRPASGPRTRGGRQGPGASPP